MTYTPPPRTTYKGSITNTDRWDDVTHRPGDVYVCTPPKCGTTWTTAIVTMLLAEDTEIAPQSLVHWVDAELMPLSDVTAGLEAAPGKRCIKTHTAFDGVPWHADAHYIAVYRHPVDAMFSLRKHLANEIDTGDDHPYLTDPDNALIAYVNSDIDPSDCDVDCLDTFLDHYRSTTTPPQPDNLLVLHYADMLNDPGSVIRQIAAHIGVSPSEAFLDAVQEATSFGNMKSNPDRFTPYADKGYWHNAQAFFHSAGTHKWEGEVSEITFSHYRVKMRAELSPEDIAWLENGSTGG